MANVKIRSASLFIEGKKVGQISDIDYTYDTGDEMQFGDPGYLGHSDGAPTTKLDAKGIIPLAGLDVDIIGLMQQKATFNIALGVIAGKIHQVAMRGKSAKVTGSQKNGTLTGDFSWEGGDFTSS